MCQSDIKIRQGPISSTFQRAYSLANDQGTHAMKTVYIVDDSQVVRERLIGMISEVEGTALAGASGDPREAVKAIQRLHPDAVILDIRMPGMNGIQVLREIKRAQRPPLVIMLTNYAFEQYRRECAEAGADHFLNKSKEFEKINGILAGIVHADLHSNNQTGG
jgi:DNA-binding NarL/FixJ family response regulator